MSVQTFAPTADSVAWAQAALNAAHRITADPEARAWNLRHGETWFVGVDALPNAADGSVDGVPLKGPWEPHLNHHGPLHKAQLSIIYPGYPARDPDQSEANHRYRVNRCAAHMDGLLPEGPERRRFAREFHAYVLGIHLNDCDAAPTVYWEGSEHIMRAALIKAIGAEDPETVDLTEPYHAARREVFERCEMKRLTGPHGGSFLMHRFTLHGTAPWEGPDHTDGRITAFFRPEFATDEEWLHAP